jgi:hypothetical protein
MPLTKELKRNMKSVKIGFTQGRAVLFKQTHSTVEEIKWQIMQKIPG